ncbi:hypothetical protein AMS68_004658 [Peltaster fructicola]|uniref:Uncharacterized protein n=1 Tax=Peltaster fructicola TaxID=286661 RepID=A0A6H0XWV4_9PEZI|nr:hypothetical protein AMS68_004658 [Peltaster fructicola]
MMLSGTSPEHSTEGDAQRNDSTTQVQVTEQPPLKVEEAAPPSEIARQVRGDSARDPINETPGPPQNDSRQLSLDNTALPSERRPALDSSGQDLHLLEGLGATNDDACNLTSAPVSQAPISQHSLSARGRPSIAPLSLQLNSALAGSSRPPESSQALIERVCPESPVGSGQSSSLPARLDRVALPLRSHHRSLSARPVLQSAELGPSFDHVHDASGDTTPTGPAQSHASEVDGALDEQSGTATTTGSLHDAEIWDEEFGLEPYRPLRRHDFGSRIWLGVTNRQPVDEGRRTHETSRGTAYTNEDVISDSTQVTNGRSHGIANDETPESHHSPPHENHVNGWHRQQHLDHEDHSDNGWNHDGATEEHVPTTNGYSRVALARELDQLDLDLGVPPFELREHIGSETYDHQQSEYMHQHRAQALRQEVLHDAHRTTGHGQANQNGHAHSDVYASRNGNDPYIPIGLGSPRDDQHPSLTAGEEVVSDGHSPTTILRSPQDLQSHAMQPNHRSLRSNDTRPAHNVTYNPVYNDAQQDLRNWPQTSHYWGAPEPEQRLPGYWYHEPEVWYDDRAVYHEEPEEYLNGNANTRNDDHELGTTYSTHDDESRRRWQAFALHHTALMQTFYAEYQRARLEVDHYRTRQDEARQRIIRLQNDRLNVISELRRVANTHGVPSQVLTITEGLSPVRRASEIYVDQLPGTRSVVEGPTYMRECVRRGCSDRNYADRGPPELERVHSWPSTEQSGRWDWWVRHYHRERSIEVQDTESSTWRSAVLAARAGADQMQTSDQSDRLSLRDPQHPVNAQERSRSIDPAPPASDSQHTSTEQLSLSRERRMKQPEIEKPLAQQDRREQRGGQDLMDNYGEGPSQPRENVAQARLRRPAQFIVGPDSSMTSPNDESEEESHVSIAQQAAQSEQLQHLQMGERSTTQASDRSRQ